MVFLLFDTRAATGGQRGFTLIELMVTLVIVSVLLAIGVPSVARLIAGNRISTQTNEFIGALSLARAEAVRRSDGVSVRSKGGGIEFSSGWTIFRDPSLTGNAPSDAANVLRESSGFPGTTTLKRVKVSGSGFVDEAAGTSFVVFNSRGGNQAGGSAYFRVCDSGDSSIKGRILQVSTVGKVSVDNASATCP